MLRFKEGFDRGRVRWLGPKDPFPLECGYCGRPMDEREERLRVMNAHKFAQLCTDCLGTWTVDVQRPQR